MTELDAFLKEGAAILYHFPLWIHLRLQSLDQ